MSSLPINARRPTSGPLYAPAASDNDRTALQISPNVWMTMACCWALMLATFSMPGRDQAMLGSLDGIAVAKLAMRGVCLVVFSILLARSWAHARTQRAVRHMIPWIVFAGFALLSSAWSPLKSISFGQAGSFLILTMLAICLAANWRPRIDTSSVLCLLSVGLLAVSGILLAARLFAPGFASLTRDGAGVFHATSGGATASLGMLVVVASLLLWRWNWSKWLLVPSLAVHSAALLLAQNRVSVALTALLVALLVVACCDRLLSLSAVILVSIGATIYLSLDPGFDITGRLLGDAGNFALREQSSTDLMQFSGRQELWEAVWSAYGASPWIGHGYFVCSPTGELYVWYSWDNWTAHNVVLQALMSTGAVGLAVLAWAFAVLGWRCLQCCVRKVMSQRMAMFLAMMGVWYLVWGVFNSSFLGPLSPQSVVFFVVLGIADGVLASRDVSTMYQTVAGDFNHTLSLE